MTIVKRWTISRETTGNHLKLLTIEGENLYRSQHHQTSEPGPVVMLRNLVMSITKEQVCVLFNAHHLFLFNALCYDFFSINAHVVLFNAL